VTIADAKRDLDWLTLVWGDLMQSRLKGSPRTWLHHRTSGKPEQHPGDDMVTVNGMPAPVHLDVLDQIVDVIGWSSEAAENIAQELGVDRPPYATSAHDDPRPWLRFIRDNIGLVENPQLAGVVAKEAQARSRRAKQMLGETPDWFRLPFDCPYCGETRLTFRKVRDSDPVIACYGAKCVPDENFAGHHTFQGRLAWRYPFDHLVRLVCEYAPGEIGTASEVAEATGVNFRRLRNWVLRGKIKPVGTDGRGRPLYRSADVAAKLAENA
jgi:hypothetical protein